MNTITPAELARRARVSKQAIHKAITSGLIPFTGEGRRKRINPEDPAVVVYITDPSHQRETAAENWPKKQVKPAPPSQIREPKPIESTPPSEKQERKSRKPPPTHSSDPDAAEIKRRTQIAEMRKKELVAAHLERLLLPVDFLEDKVFRYLSKLHSNIERAAGVGIDEIGPKIIEAGEVTPAHIEEFTNVVLKIIHETKLGIIREIKSYEPKTKP